MDGAKVYKAAIISYPGSGDHILKAIIENTTGHEVGSDLPLESAFSSNLTTQTNIDLPIISTHYPLNLSGTEFSTKKLIILIRNFTDI